MKVNSAGHFGSGILLSLDFWVNIAKVFVVRLRGILRLIVMRKINCLLSCLLIFSLVEVNTGCRQHSTETDATTETKSIKSDLARLSDSIASNPSDAGLYYRRAAIFLGKDNTRQAFDDISKAIAIDSTRAEYYLLKADICFKGLLIQQSIAAFEKVIVLEPRNTEAQLKLAELFLYLKAYPQCMTHANEALRIDKNLPKAYFIKGFAYKETGDTVKALSSFQTCVEINSDYYDAYIQLGNLEAARRHTIAIQYYNNALRLQPASTEALYNRGLFFQNLGDLENALSDYNRILKIDPNYSNAYFNLGYIDLAYRKDYKAAIVHFTDAIRVNNQYLEAFYNRGVCFEMTGDIPAAIKDYNAALSIVPTYKLAQDKLNKLSGKTPSRPSD
jgi:tetratricopeptide (TPR) repeat protein